MTDAPLPNCEIILYQTDDGRTSMQARLQDEAVWVTQQMAELFQAAKQNEGQHLKSFFAECVLVEDPVVKDSFTYAAHGRNYSTKFYNLDVIISVCYWVKSVWGTQFRQWTTGRLNEDLVKGFTMDEDRIRDIRSPIPHSSFEFRHVPLLANPPFTGSDPALCACAFLQGEAIMRVVSEAKDSFHKDDGVPWQPSGTRSTARSSLPGERGSVRSFGVPPKGNASFAWVQNLIHHLAPQCMAGFVLANDRMSSNQSGEGDIRRALIETNLEMSIDDLRVTNRFLGTATFEVRSSSFELCLWPPRPALLQHGDSRLPLLPHEKQNADAKRVFHDCLGLQNQLALAA